MQQNETKIIEIKTGSWSLGAKPAGIFPYSIELENPRERLLLLCELRPNTLRAMLYDDSLAQPSVVLFRGLNISNVITDL